MPQLHQLARPCYARPASKAMCDQVDLIIALEALRSPTKAERHAQVLHALKADMPYELEVQLRALEEVYGKAVHGRAEGRVAAVPRHALTATAQPASTMTTHGMPSKKGARRAELARRKKWKYLL